MIIIPRVIPKVISLRVIEIKVSDLHWTPFCDVVHQILMVFCWFALGIFALWCEISMKLHINLCSLICNFK